MKTNEWEPEQNGPGQMHPFVLKHHMDIDKQEQMSIICGGGFSYYEGELKFHSKWLNAGYYCGKNSPYGSDGSKVMSEKEKKLTRHIFNEWKKRGNHIIIQIPDSLDRELLK